MARESRRETTDVVERPAAGPAAAHAEACLSAVFHERAIWSDRS